jgi:hypothetical protein
VRVAELEALATQPARAARAGRGHGTPNALIEARERELIDERTRVSTLHAELQAAGTTAGPISAARRRGGAQHAPRAARGAPDRLANLGAKLPTSPIGSQQAELAEARALMEQAEGRDARSR